ncbi:ATP-binding SpoIIE family protein phosphatase [Chthoniobacter flavus]|uniref:ATP-binding SpoIIE family protein phosphatase n=1 Tax=Chthoniobacter flavus TaxID=191863 RepID=UPI0002DDEF5E|nr:ATP-binding SpoIIE family protein phosphatase [Chthoniobacter flavus]
MEVARPAEIKRATDAARRLAASLGFGSQDCDEIVLAVTELATNLTKHTRGGTITLRATDGRAGIQVESEDRGPGILDVEQALTDGYSTAGSLGTGLGTVNRLMHELEFYSLSPTGTRIVCQRWLRAKNATPFVRWLEFGAATRAYRRQPENGDTFFIRQWEGGALAGVIDGLGHGPFAQRAAQCARRYLDQHFDQSLENLFRGAGRACSATRGVVMALARFNAAQHTVATASVGNIETRLIGGADRNVPVRRGVVGLNAPNPVVAEHPWTPESILIMHSDGLRTQWAWEEFRHVATSAPGIIAQRLLTDLGKIDDDATVLVARTAKP